MNALAYTIIGILSCTTVAFGFLANKGIRNLEDEIARDVEEMWFELTTLSIRLEREIAKREEAAAAPTVARNAARKAAPAVKAVATARSASKVEAKKAVKKTVAKKAPAKKAAAK